MPVKMLNQKWHLIIKGGKTTVRRQWLGPDVEMYSSKDDPELGRPAMFGEHEQRQFLERLGPWMMASVSLDDDVTSNVLMTEGWTDPDGVKWYMPDGAAFVRDEGMVHILTPNRMSKADFLRKLGFHINLKKHEDKNKVSKYLKRLWSPHKNYVQGDIIQRFGDYVFLVQLPNGKRILVKYMDQLNDGLSMQIVDGMNLITKRCLDLLDHKGIVGSGLKLTALSPHGLSKGFAIVMDNLDFDLILYGSKPQLTGDKFTIAIDDIKPGKLLTDVQSVLNFQLYRSSFMVDWTIKFYRDVLEALGDEEKLKSMLNFYNMEFHKEDRGMGDFIEQESDWALLRALREDIAVTNVPALMRKVSHLFLNRVMDCYKKIRIPVPEDVGTTRYILVDPTVFMKDGRVNLNQGVLNKDQVYVPGIQGEVVFHRQPNAHRSEHYAAFSVYNARLAALNTDTFMFASAKNIKAMLDALGGGDQDDRVCIYTDPKVVEHFGELIQYQLEPLVIDMATEQENIFSDYLRKLDYDNLELKNMLSQQKRQRMSIGRAVNPLMQDAAISDNYQMIVAQLKAIPNPTEKQQSAIRGLGFYNKDMLRKLASRLEHIIDSIKKSGGDLSIEDKMVKDFYKFLPVVANCLRDRLPASLQGEKHPVIVLTPLDHVLSRIRDIRQQLDDTITHLEWQRVSDIPVEVATYPTNPSGINPSPAAALARTIRNFYGQEASRQLVNVDQDDWQRRMTIYTKDGGIDDVTFKHFKDHPFIIDAMVELYILVYSERRSQAPKGEDGKLKHYPDGILWGPRMSGLTVKMLRRCGLTSRFVSMDTWFNKKYKRATLDVRVNTGIVTPVGQDDQIGLADPLVPDTTTTSLDQGLLKVPGNVIFPVSETDAFIYLIRANHVREKDLPRMRLDDWNSYAHEIVMLVPYEYFPIDQPGHFLSVNVVLKDSGVSIGYVDGKEVEDITEPTEARLIPSAENYVLYAVVGKK